MGAFDDLLASDAGFFVATDNGGETVEYTPLGGVPRNININVVRGAPRETPEANKVFGARLDIEAINSVSTGISVSATDTIGGILKVAERRGQTPKSFTIRHENIVSQDAGMLRLSF
jgi:hypothetical protein